MFAGRATSRPSASSPPPAPVRENSRGKVRGSSLVTGRRRRAGWAGPTWPRGTAGTGALAPDRGRRSGPAPHAGRPFTTTITKDTRDDQQRHSRIGNPAPGKAGSHDRVAG